MTGEQLKKLNNIFGKYPDLKLVYLFGSQVSGKTGPLSDYDFAFYIKGDKKKAYILLLRLRVRSARCCLRIKSIQSS